MSYIFTHTRPGVQAWGSADRSPTKTVTIEIEEDDLTIDELCGLFQDFAKGCGFVLDHGNIEFVPHSEYDSDVGIDSHLDSEPSETEDPNQMQMDFSEEPAAVSFGTPKSDSANV